MERNNLSILKYVYIKVFYRKIEKNVRIMRTRMDLIFWKRRKQIFFQLQPSFNDKKSYMKTDTRLLMYIDKQSSVQCSYEVTVYQEALF